jgi:lipid II:glycine glycyltransferase (peptidoglycan interpeptide bridge formation enzyme)
MADLKKLNYKLESISLKSLLQSEDIRLFVVQDVNGKILSARIIHVSHPFSSDVLAANSINSRSFGAAYFIMQNIFKILHEEGFKHFDFGRIPPSDHATDNVYQFKSFTRGNSIQYNGNWSFYENKWLEFLMFCFKNFKLKLQRY